MNLSLNTMNAVLNFELSHLKRPLPDLDSPMTVMVNTPGKTAPSIQGRPLLVGDRNYLRALRAAEMKAWQASGGDVLNFTP